MAAAASWREVWRSLVSIFTARGFRLLSTAAIMRSRARSTLFMGAGLQIFEGTIFDGEPALAGAIFVHQPVVRLNYLKRTGQPGYSTAFVNLCSEQIRSNVSIHAAHLRAWVDALTAASVGPLELSLDDQSWRGGPFGGVQLNVRASGLLIGDAIIIVDGPDGALPLLPISDFSFGLERITAAANASRDFWPNVMAPSIAQAKLDIRAVDALRTATLLVLCGVTPSARSHGRELRRLYKIAAALPRNLDTATAVGEFAAFWREFLPADDNASTANVAAHHVLSGIERARCADDKLARRSGSSASRPRGESTCVL